MPPPLPSNLEPSATYAQILNSQDASLPAFLEACKSNDVALASQLVKGRDRGALTFGLNRAVGAGHLEMGRQLLELGAKWDAETVNLASRSLDALKLLVGFGFNVNDPLPRGDVLLLMVVGRNDEPFIRYLLSQGANPNLGPPLNPQETIFWRIRPIQNSGSALNAAAASHTPEIFALLLSHGAIISNAIPLHYAAGVGPNVPPGSRIPLMEYLVGLGLDVNSIDDAVRQGDVGHGQHGTPLHYAVMWGRTQEAK